MNENTTIKTPEACNLFDEMLDMMKSVAEAKQNAKAWNEEARARMRKVRLLVNTQRAIDPEAPEVAAFMEALNAAISEETPSGTYDDITPEGNTEDTEA